MKAAAQHPAGGPGREGSGTEPSPDPGAGGPQAACGRLTRWIRYEVARPGRPSVVQTLRVGELAHAASMAQYGRLAVGGASPRLSGRDGGGRPNRTHEHAHWLVLDEDGDMRIDHLVLWVPGGLGARETAACLLIDGLREPSAVVGRDALALRLTVTGLDAEAGAPAWLVGPASRWHSRTPFVPPRHTKWVGSGAMRRILEAPEDQLRREIALRGLPADVVAVAELDPAVMAATRLWRPAPSVRPHERGRLPSVAIWWDVTFDRPVMGPLVLGHAAHYGMGMFAAAAGVSAQSAHADHLSRPCAAREPLCSPR